MTKYIKKLSNIYMINETDSIFTSRIGKRDIRVCLRGQWGGRYGEGNNEGQYRTLRIYDSETGEIVRDYEHIPDEFSFQSLRDIL